MDLFRSMRERRSIRVFKKTLPPRDVIEEILDAATWAPSGMNRQNWYFVVVTGDVLTKILGASRRAFEEHLRESLSLVFKEKPEIVDSAREFFSTLGHAPVVILVYRTSTIEGDLTDIQSVAAAIQNLLLAAHAKGLGGCWMTGPTHLAEEINAAVGVSDKNLQAVIPIGYANEEPPAPRRRGNRLKWIGFE